MIPPGTGNLIQTLLNFNHNRIHIYTVIILTGNDRITVVRHGAYIFNPCGGCHGSLYGCCYLHLHLFRTGSHIRRNDQRILQIHGWKQICGHFHQGYYSQYDDKQNTYQNCIGLFYTIFCKHSFSSSYQLKLSFIIPDVLLKSRQPSHI